MSVNKLTQRAKSIILQFEDKKQPTAKNVLDAISNSSGLGSMLLKGFPKLKANKRSRVDITNLTKEAFNQAIKCEHTYVGTEHILLALLKTTKSSDYKAVKEQLLSSNTFPRALKYFSNEKFAGTTSVLGSFSSNMNKDFIRMYNEPLVYRDTLEQLISVLLKKENANALIVGDTGVGKNALIQLLVRNILSLDVPPALAGHKVIEFDLMSYISSVANRANQESALVSFQNELSGLYRSIVSVKNFQNLFVSTASGIGVPIIYSMFKEMLETSGLSFIATMNSSVFEKVGLENSHLLENFTVIELEEPTEAEVIEMLKLKAKVFGEFHNIKISDAMVNLIYEKANNLISGTKFPQKGVDLLDVSCASLLVKKSRVPNEYKNLVDTTVVLLGSLDKSLDVGNYDDAIKLQEEIRSLEVAMTKHEEAMVNGKPLKLSKEDILVALEELDFDSQEEDLLDTATLRSLDSKIKQQIVGQDIAVDTVVKALIRSKMGLRPQVRPIGNFLFLGPTGVGKTELAKVLGKETNLIRLDMSDFGEKHTVARLVGAPPGYVGYGDGGELTSKIEENPESVVLFDEIEKAHPDVLNILLQIMEEGELSDAKGNTYDFSKSIVILTSNLGTEILHDKEIGFVDGIKLADNKKISSHLKENLKKILKPELLNRFDEIIVFRSLNVQDQMKVLDILLDGVVENLKKQQVTLKILKPAKKALINIGYSKEYGARSLRRTIEKELLDRVAEILLKKKKRPLKISVTFVKDKFILKV